ncbi:MAG: AraC family transcriptional regulator [Gammaproteobacteria bacterium]|nr:AraC family transcriptional regulator [Gammaproteobacteria bacterium]
MKNPLQSTDPLGEALHFLRMSGMFYCRSELSAPWALAVPAVRGCIGFHVVTAGHCWLEVEDAERVLLEPGDLALVPHGRGQRLGDTPTTPAVPLAQLPLQHVNDRYSTLNYGGGGDTTILICGEVMFDHPAAQRLMTLLPKVIHLKAKGFESTDWLSSTLRFIASEARARRPGGETVITRLADILVIQAIRAWIEQDPQAQGGWLGALRDPQIGCAIAAIHQDATRPWTVESLAAEVAMSRSAFAARFTELVGEPAMQYVARWRMHLALMWLREDNLSVGEIASRLDYQSEAAFSRAFKRFIGAAPGAMRRQETQRDNPIAATPAAPSRRATR